MIDRYKSFFLTAYSIQKKERRCAAAEDDNTIFSFFSLLFYLRTALFHSYVWYDYVTIYILKFTLTTACYLHIPFFSEQREDNAR